MECGRLCVLMVVAALTACAEPDERPDVISVCDGPNCQPMPVDGGQSPSGSGGATSTTSATTGNGSPTLSGSVALFRDDTFDLPSALPYAEPATIFSLDPNRRLISAEYDGQQFTLSGLVSSESTELLVVPQANDGLAIPTLLALDTRRSARVSLPLVNRQELTAIYSTINAQTVIDESRAQLVYHVFDAAGVPLAGVRVNLVGAEFIAYASGAAWSDALGETDARGLVVLGNIPALELPGSNAPVSLSGSVSGEQVVTLVRGAASYVRVRFE
jgi:hypothetical protein